MQINSYLSFIIHTDCSNRYVQDKKSFSFLPVYMFYNKPMKLKNVLSFLRPGSIDHILLRRKMKRRSDMTDDIENILFLDYDGVINTDLYNYGQEPFNQTCMKNVEKLCREYDLKIVVTSSWREYRDYPEYLRKSGLSEEIEILGCTEILHMFREDEIKDYLKKHIYIHKFVILDDIKDLGDLEPYHVCTEFEKGFDEEKYQEAKKILEEKF